MVKRIYISSKGIICLLEASEETITKVTTDEFTRHYIPDVELFERCSHEPYVTVFGTRTFKGASIDYPSAQFRDGIDHRDVVSLCDYLLERARQEKLGYYSLSSATASLENRAVSFFAGATNSGKTSSMLDLVSHAGFDFFSDEHTLIDLSNKEIVGGSRSVATRKKILKDRLSTKGEFLDLPCSFSRKKAELFIYPHLDHGLNEPIFYQFKPLDFYWLLSRELGGTIRGSVKFVENFTFPLPSIDTDELSQRRVASTKIFTDQVPCFYFQGSLEQMREFVKSYLGKYDQR